jgi:hypothetical protein
LDQYRYRPSPGVSVVLEISVPAREVNPEGTRIPIVNADATPEQPPDQAG